MACASCSSVASGLPSRRFSATDIENSVGSSNAVATACRSAGNDSSRMSRAVDEDRALGDVVEPRQQRHQHRLARTGRPDEGERLAGFDGEVDVAQRPVSRCRGTGTPRRPVPAGHRAGFRRRAVGDVARRVEDLGDAVGRRHRLLRHRQQEAQRRDGPHQRQHHRDERDQRAHGDQPVARRVGAEAEHDDQAGVRDHLEQRPELRRHRRPCAPRCRTGRWRARRTAGRRTPRGRTP